MCITAECADPTEVGVWWRDDASWRLYSKPSMMAILQALLHANPSLHLPLLTSSAHPRGSAYHIDLVKMVQTNTASGHKRAIKLILPSSMKNRNSNFFTKVEHSMKAAGGDSRARFRMQNSCWLLICKGDIVQWAVDGKADTIVNPCHRWGSRRHGDMERSLASVVETPMTTSATEEKRGLTSCNGTHGNKLSKGHQKKQAKGGVATALYNAAGPELLQSLQECVRFATCRGRSGDAIITQGYKLRASHVIHAIAPKYRGLYCESDVHVKNSSCGMLERTYKSALTMAMANGVQYVAFPAIGCGAGGFPVGVAARLALEAVSTASNKGGVREIHFVVKSGSEEEGLFKEWVMEAKRLFCMRE